MKNLKDGCCLIQRIDIFRIKVMEMVKSYFAYCTQRTAQFIWDDIKQFSKNGLKKLKNHMKMKTRIVDQTDDQIKFSIWLCLRFD